MGRNRTLRRKEAREAKKRQETARTGMSRRQFLTTIGILGVGAAVGIPTYQNFGGDDRWDFLDVDPLELIKKDIVPKYRSVIDACIPLGPENDFEQGSERLQGIVQDSWSTIVEEARKHNIPSDSLGLKVTSQHYCAVADERIAQSALAYVHEAHSFLLEKITGLVKKEVDWQVLNRTSAAKDLSGRGFIGSHSYDIEHIAIINRSNGKEVSSFSRALRPDYGAYCDYYVDKKHDFRLADSWHLFLSANQSILYSPFSEIIPLTTISPTYQNSRDGDVDDIIVKNETISEGLSIILASELSDTLGVPNGRTLLREMAEVNQNFPRYRYVPQSADWIERNGIQNAFDLYMESPEKYMKAIGAE